MTYDTLNRMTSWTDGTNTESTAYVGARWHRSSYTPNGGSPVYFLYDLSAVPAQAGGDNVAADLVDGVDPGSYDGSKLYVTPFLDQNLSVTDITNPASPVTRYYSQDRRNSVTTVTTAAGAMSNVYDYTAMGEKLAYTHETAAQRYQYTGREFNSVSGEHYFRYRTYSPSTGMFFTRDPLGYVDGSSLYSGYFAAALGADPMGLFGLARTGGGLGRPAPLPPYHRPVPLYDRLPAWARVPGIVSRSGFGIGTGGPGRGWQLVVFGANRDVPRALSFMVHHLGGLKIKTVAGGGTAVVDADWAWQGKVIQIDTLQIAAAGIGLDQSLVHEVTAGIGMKFTGYGEHWGSNISFGTHASHVIMELAYMGSIRGKITSDFVQQRYGVLGGIDSNKAAAARQNLLAAAIACCEAGKKGPTGWTWPKSYVLTYENTLSTKRFVARSVFDCDVKRRIVRSSLVVSLWD